MKNIDIKDKRLQDIVDKIVAVSTPQKIVLYGSRARQENGSRSDFDVAVFGKVNMGKVFDSVQEARTLLNIDIVAFDDLSDDLFKQKILKEGVIIYERKI